MTAQPPAVDEVDGRALAKASMVAELRKRGMEPVRPKPVDRPDSDFDFPVLKTVRR